MEQLASLQITMCNKRLGALAIGAIIIGQSRSIRKTLIWKNHAASADLINLNGIAPADDKIRFRMLLLTPCEIRRI